MQHLEQGPGCRQNSRISFESKAECAPGLSIPRLYPAPRSLACNEIPRSEQRQVLFAASVGCRHDQNSAQRGARGHQGRATALSQATRSHIFSLRALQVFQGNFDNDTHRKNVIDPPIYARHVRILPWSWYGRITLRSELLGCTAED